eukprot:TRINITY_DN22313_c0_g1_i1.p1 TRINITY_DN22313_c0_g1~~TRINITY_DN22313_c0_g1_i1.p1  ORF type:complete len:248 (-),score=42.41 TRINITY_DN22313_c0_g1_i1:163-906(-)
MMVKAVIFDLDDTLVHTSGADEIALASVGRIAVQRSPDIDAGALLEAFVKLFKTIPWDPEGKVAVDDWRASLWGRALSEQGIVDSALAKDLQESFNLGRLEAFVWIDGVETLVRELHESGIKTGIVTNGHKDIQRAKLVACKADQLFDTIIVGGEEENEKPHASIFLRACEMMECLPEDTVMVGDNLYTDIQGGINAGFASTVWINPKGLELPGGAPTPTYTVPSVTGLADILRGLTCQCRQGQRIL